MVALLTARRGVEVLSREKTIIMTENRTLINVSMESRALPKENPLHDNGTKIIDPSGEPYLGAIPECKAECRKNAKELNSRLGCDTGQSTVTQNVQSRQTASRPRGRYIGRALLTLPQTWHISWRCESRRRTQRSSGCCPWLRWQQRQPLRRTG